MSLRWATILLCAIWGSVSRGADAGIEPAAEKLAAATVTMRVSPPVNSAADEKKEPHRSSGAADKTSPRASANADSSGDASEVTVCSGVSLGKGLIVSFHAMPSTDAGLPRFRVTQKGGEQAEATLRVIDRHSGLILLEAANEDLPGLALARETPKVGSRVLTAAAAGIEEAAVSAGIVGATDRTLTGVDLPPLLQCDLRTTETSSGAAVVNAEGELLGIVVATRQSRLQAGWTYAMPVRHVARIVAAKVPGKVIELKRRRPVVGFTIGAGDKEGTVVVERVDRVGPAATAGIHAGDQVVEADGLKVRSAYQAINLILRKLPGDKMTFVVEREGETRKVDVLLGGGASSVAEIPQAITATVKVGPQLKASRSGGEITIRDNNTLAEVAVDPDRGETRRSPGNEAELLRLQLGAYERVFDSMQKQIESLRRETAQLREQLESQRNAGNGAKKAPTEK